MSGKHLKRKKEKSVDNQQLKKEYQKLLIDIMVVVIIGFLLFSQVFLLRRASGNEMFPAIKDGDLMLGFRLQQNYVKNDVVVYKVKQEYHVGRVLGVEGDIITIDETGNMMVNGTTETGEILFSTYPKETLQYPYRIPENTIFVLGDYRTKAEDSRDYGAISLDEVEAKIITILRRRML